jgi:hypothetical protein
LPNQIGVPDLVGPALQILVDLLVVLGCLLQDLRSALIGDLAGEPAGDGCGSTAPRT